MTKRDFRFFVRIGHGKAILEIQKNGDDGFDEIILAACRKETLYDTWFEEDKGWYLAQLLVATGRPKHYLSLLINEDHLIKGVANVRQWASIVGNLGRLGYDEAAAYTADRWQNDLNRKRRHWAKAHIIAQGFQGYRDVLTWMEANWRKRTKPVSEMFRLHFEADERIGNLRSEKIRGYLAKRSPWLPIVSDFPGANEQSGKPQKEQLSVTEKILGDRFVGGRSLIPVEIQTVCQLLKQDLDPKQLSRAIGVFSSTTYPGDPSDLVSFLKVDDEKIVFAALECFAKLPYPPIRDYAFTLCNDDYLRSSCIQTLCANFQKGDEAWVYDLLVKNSKSEYLHNDVISAREVIETNPKGKWNDCLQFLYRTTPCQLCRGDVAEQLHQQSKLTSEQIAELRFDAYSTTRKWANRLKLPIAKEPEPTR